MLDFKILRTDASGMPIEWIGYQEAARLHHLGLVVYSLGERLRTLHGGINARTGRRSIIELNSIIATRHSHSGGYHLGHDYVPPLSNPALFQRDDHLCLYCGNRFSRYHLSRDHVIPLCQGGQDLWSNVVSACKTCNCYKAGRRPEEAGMQLLAVPFTPTYAEYIYLQGHRILADQMEFLKSHFPRKSPLRNRVS